MTVTVTVARRRVPALACRLKQRELGAALLAGDQELLRRPEKAKNWLARRLGEGGVGGEGVHRCRSLMTCASGGG